MSKVIEKWRLDRRYWYVRDVKHGNPQTPYLAVVDDFGNLIEVE